MADPAIERMFLAKTLFLQGERLCANHKDLFDFSRGILSLQDAVELALGAIATKTHVHFPKLVSFPEQFKKIDEKLKATGSRTLPFQRELLQLNG